VQPVPGQLCWQPTPEDLCETVAAASEHLMHHGLIATAVGGVDQRVDAPAVVSNPPSTLGRGLNDDAETRRTKPNSNHGHHCAVIIVAPPTAARRRATSHCTNSTASVQPGPCRIRRNTAVVK